MRYSQSALNRQRRIARRMTEGFRPNAFLAYPDGTSFRVFASGLDKFGRMACAFRRGTAHFTSMTQMSVPPKREDTNASFFPSGCHAGDVSCAWWPVKFVAPVPSAFISQMS